MHNRGLSWDHQLLCAAAGPRGIPPGADCAGAAREGGQDQREGAAPKAQEEGREQKAPQAGRPAALRCVTHPLVMRYRDLTHVITCVCSPASTSGHPKVLCAAGKREDDRPQRQDLKKILAGEGPATPSAAAGPIQLQVAVPSALHLVLVHASTAVGPCEAGNQ